LESTKLSRQAHLSIIIPCYNEEATLKCCIEKVLEIQDEHLVLDIIIIDDCSNDTSGLIGSAIQEQYSNIRYFRHEINQGKGAAIHTGIKEAKGDFVAIQDADLEYNPLELRKLVAPLVNDKADVVFGSRFLSTGPHRVLYFWHSLGNKFLTTLSNMLTDLNLTDMETCYKVFKREIIQSLELKEKRFGFEPEVVAKVAQKRCRIFEMGVTYNGRTYAEGKKIGIKDGWHAIYCVLRYNLHKAPLPIQLFFYLLIGGIAAIFNQSLFMVLDYAGIKIPIATITAFLSAAAVNYVLCITILFRHKVRWGKFSEILMFILVISGIGIIDLFTTLGLINLGISNSFAKLYATMAGFILNFLGRKYIVFPEPGSPEWEPSIISTRK
jgi:glycosyltransferase involved in cell wall biosynthesis